MKHYTKRIFSFLLTVCMMLGMLPVFALTSNAATSVAKAYDTAADGELLYTLNFNFDDVYKDAKSTAVSDSIYKISGENGEKLTFTNKAAGDHYYGGTLKEYPIIGHVYTVSYYVENSSSAAIRASAQFFNDGKRIGLVNGKVANDQLYIQLNGTAGMKLDNTIARKVDTENNNRRNYKVVIDGINMVAKFYAMNTEGVYEWLVNIDIDFGVSGFKDYLSIGLFCYDAVSETQEVSLGDVQIVKGDAFTTAKTAYQTAYDNAEYGDVLYDINFNDLKDGANGWGAFRGNLNLTNDAISEDGDSLTLNYSEKSVAQYLSASLPDKNAINYGSFTYEFYLESDMRVGLHVLGNTAGGSNYGIGFSYFNPTAGQLYMVSASWQYYTYQYFKGGVYRGEAAVETADGSYNQTPDTGDDITCNVKIEVDTVNKKITNYILVDGEFTKTASISFAGCAFYPIIYPYVYNQSPNATFENMVIKKGLTVTGEDNENKLLDLTIDGKSSGLQIVTNQSELPAITEKAFYTAEYQLNGVTVSNVADLKLNARYNAVDLVTVYTPVAVKGNMELRGIQSSLTPNTTTNTTSIRLVGVLDSLDFAEAGFLVSATYKDANGTVYDGNALADKSCTVAYKAINAGDCASVSAEELGGKYLVALAITGVPIGEGVQVDFTVIPYTVAIGAEKNPETLEGYDYDENNAKTVSFVNGEYKADAEPIAW